MDSTTPFSRLSVSSPRSSNSDGIQKARQRTITACLTCRRRKVKCDHTQPTCTPCKKGNRACIYAIPQPASHNPSHAREGNRVSRSNLRTGQEEIRNRLERLERLLERAIVSGGSISQSPDVRVYSSENPRDVDQVKGASPNPRAETLSTDGFDGALLLEAEEGQSRWVSSLHYALLADQVCLSALMISCFFDTKETRSMMLKCCLGMNLAASQWKAHQQTRQLPHSRFLLPLWTASRLRHPIPQTTAWHCLTYSIPTSIR